MVGYLSSCDFKNFKPSDEILVTKYLFGKSQGQEILDVPIPDIDVYAHVGFWDKIYSEIKDQNTIYCFTKLKKKTERGNRVDRMAEFGTWKSQSDTKISFMDVMHAGSLRKFTFVVDKGMDTRDRWVMHEYRLDGCFENKKNDYVLCRLIRRANKNAISINHSMSFFTPPNKLSFLPRLPHPTNERNPQGLESFLAAKPNSHQEPKHMVAFRTPQTICQGPASSQNNKINHQQSTKHLIY